jgi:hypothetical protein
MARIPSLQAGKTDYTSIAFEIKEKGEKQWP